MKVPGGNHVDRQRRLTPREYLADPFGYGRDPAARFVLPADGDVVSLRIAMLQHRLLVGWEQVGAPSGAELGRRWGVSKQTISRTRRGERWMGEALMAALLEVAGAARTRRGDGPAR